MDRQNGNNLSGTTYILGISAQCTTSTGMLAGIHTTAQVKTIAGAIDAVLKSDSGQWLCNTYCINMGIAAHGLDILR